MTDWKPRYSGPGQSGVCRCGHSHWDHHGGVVMNQEYFAATGEGRVPGGCEFYGCNEGEGLDAEGKPHCFNYEDKGVIMCDEIDKDDPPPLSVVVTKADNGYIVEGFDGLIVCESEGLTVRSDCEAAATMLYAVLEQLGELGTKHDEYRTRVAVIERETGRDVMGGLTAEGA